MKTFIKLATDLMGTKLKTPQEEDVGVVQNILLDPKHGTIVYIVLCYGNFIGKVHRHFAIPYQMLTVKYADKGSIFLEIDKKKLLNAQLIAPGDWSMSTMPYIPFDTQCIYEILPDESQKARMSILKSALAN